MAGLRLGDVIFCVQLLPLNYRDLVGFTGALLGLTEGSSLGSGQLHSFIPFPFLGA